MFLKLNLLRLCLKSFQKVHFEIPAESTHTHPPPHAGLGDTDEQGGVGGGGGHSFLFRVAVKWRSNCGRAAGEQIGFLKPASISAIHGAQGCHTQSVCST